MKSKTSCFNLSLLKKDITRFLPVWLLYAVFLILTLILSTQNLAPAAAAANIANLMIGTAILNCIYALICAATLFGDLYVTKMCNALHAMPLRRDQWFLIHCTAAFLFSFVPNLLVTLIACFVLKEFFTVAFLWLLVSSLQFLFFFGIAAFCSFCAGNRQGLTAMYGLMNFLSMIIAAFISVLYLPLLRGLTLPWEHFQRFCPVVWMCLDSYLAMDKGIDTITWTYTEQWNYLWICAAVGLIFLLLALILYRKRHLERAGDFLAFKGIVPPFLIITTLVCGLVFFMISGIFLVSVHGQGSHLFLFIGMAIGYFVSQMLLHRSLRVLGTRSVVGFVLLAVISMGSIYLVSLDPMKLVEKLPRQEDVQVCTVDMMTHQNAIPEYTSPEDIQRVLQLHQISIDDDSRDNGYGYKIEIQYTLKNGKTMVRRYSVAQDSPANSPITEALSALFSRQDIVFGDHSLQYLKENIHDLRFNYWETDPESNLTTTEVYDQAIPEEFTSALMDAMWQDCEEGHMAQGYMFGSNSDVHYMLRVDNPQRSDLYVDYRISIPENAVHTLQILRTIAQNVNP